jgi:hypothetical protein
MKFGSQGKEDGELYKPETPILDKDGNIIVTDCINHRIQIFG